MVLKEPYTSLTLTVLPVYLIKLGEMVLKEFQDPLLLPWDGRIEPKNDEICRGFDLTDWPTVGHTLATTHIYNLKYTSLRLRMVFLCVHGPLPDP